MSLLAQLRNIISGCNCQNSAFFRALIYHENVTSGRSHLLKRKIHYGAKEKYIPFEKMLQYRRSEAKRSIVVQVGSISSFNELYKYCSKYGPVRGVHHYTLDFGKQHYMLVEFCDEKSLHNLMATGSSFPNGLDIIRVPTPLMWFRNSNPKSSAKDKSAVGKLATEDGCRIIDEEALKSKLQKCTSVSEQIETLFKSTVLTDLGTRIRFIVARQIEVAMSSLHADAVVWPFGSSVNGYGRNGCDLDLIYRMGDDTKKDLPSNRLVFHTKKSIITGRLQQQRYMELISDILQLYVPGCSNIRRILQARVPIVKYNQDYSGLECDLSMSNMSGVYMSELLYLYGCFDERVRPLVFTIRKWAQSVGLTNASPGKWITNFPLTLLVLFFLQQKTKDGAILPSYKSLVGEARSEDRRITEDLINCTFLRDIRQFAHVSMNGNDLETLLMQFFTFYATFDFEGNAISINEGEAIRKKEHAAMSIVNPLEMQLNVSKNVTYEECERLRIEVRNAAWILEEEMHKAKSDALRQWGIMLLFEPRASKTISNLVKIGNSQRLVSVTDLFKNEEATGEPVKVEELELENPIFENSNNTKREREKPKTRLRKR